MSVNHYRQLLDREATDGQDCSYQSLLNAFNHYLYKQIIFMCQHSFLSMVIKFYFIFLSCHGLEMTCELYGTALQCTSLSGVEETADFITNTDYHNEVAT